MSPHLAATDVGNAPAFYNALSELAPAHATDERIWATLALDRYSDYTKQRWQLVPKLTKKQELDIGPLAMRRKQSI